MNRADLYGRARRDGIKMDKLDLPDALDVIYSYVLDDSSPTFVSAMGEATFRHEARERLETALNRPVDPKAAEQYDREQFGMSATDRAARSATDAAYADNTFEPQD